ncbi:hypothetical protein SUDANB126_06455 [Streptomyces sp. enrichment culture]
MAASARRARRLVPVLLLVVWLGIGGAADRRPGRPGGGPAARGHPRAMSRVREESLRHGARRGVLRGPVGTGGAITSAGVVPAAAFAALGVVPPAFLAQIALIVAFGVLLDALVVRALLVPALALDLGPVAWWPGRLARGRGDVRERPFSERGGIRSHVRSDPGHPERTENRRRRRRLAKPQPDRRCPPP